VIKTEKPLFAEGEDPSMLDCGGSGADAQLGQPPKKSYGTGKRSDKFAFLEQVQQSMVDRKAAR
jgi:hypothetical protein